jgi:hypothetical protein
MLGPTRQRRGDDPVHEVGFGLSRADPAEPRRAGGEVDVETPFGAVREHEPDPVAHATFPAGADDAVLGRGPGRGVAGTTRPCRP